MLLNRCSLAGLMLVAAACGSKVEGTEVGNGPITGAGDDGGANGATNGMVGPGGNGNNAGTGDENLDGTCGGGVVKNEQIAPDILIVLDRSGSMNPSQNDDGTDRWTGSKNAVIASTMKYDSTIQFGLIAFPYIDTTMPGGDPCAGLTGFQLTACQITGVNPTNLGNSCGAGEVNVPVGPMTAAEIRDILTPMTAGGGTPTAPTLANAVNAIGTGLTGPDALPKPKVVLLITDGDPNCTPGAAGGGAIDTQARKQTIANIQALTDNGVRTFVIGFETAGSSFAGNLDMMAAVGGTGATKHTSVASEAELNAVLETLIGKAVSCTFTLEKAPPDPSFVLVKLDGKPLNLNQNDGWRLGPDGKTVEVLGQACATLQSNDKVHALAVEVQCAVVPVF